MPRLKRNVVRRTLFPLADSAEGVGEGGCVEGDSSERVGGGGVVANDEDDAIDERLTTLLIKGNEGSFSLPRF